MQGVRGKKDKRYGAYLLFSATLFLLYLFVFDGRSALIGTLLPSSTSSPSSIEEGGVTTGAAGETGASFSGSEALQGVENFPGFPVDLNTATVEELTVLPGIGPAIARRIVKARQENGGFASVDDLLKVKWIGRVKLETVRSLVTVGPTAGTK
ncbi:MAG: helix-hairpin-helix domain-containing protein [Proteobacteria bacterium]|nr:helix-hairpin-helix domain-containing protein [Pseudomonadota bacterium]